MVMWKAVFISECDLGELERLFAEGWNPYPAAPPVRSHDGTVFLLLTRYKTGVPLSRESAQT